MCSSACEELCWGFEEGLVKMGKSRREIRALSDALDLDNIDQDVLWSFLTKQVSAGKGIVGDVLVGS